LNYIHHTQSFAFSRGELEENFINKKSIKRALDAPIKTGTPK